MIIGYFGLPGSGKTYKMSVDALSYMRRGYYVYSNYPLKGAYKVDLETLLLLPKFNKPALVLLDEVQQVANSRNWEKLDPRLYLIFSQGRKLGLDLFYTAQDSSRVDKTLREVTNLFYDIKPFFLNIRMLLVYSRNSDYSLGVNEINRSFFIIRKKWFSYFDSFFIVSDLKQVEFQFEKWNI